MEMIGAGVSPAPFLFRYDRVSPVSEAVEPLGIATKQIFVLLTAQTGHNLLVG